jgi:hypothetical protein
MTGSKRFSWRILTLVIFASGLSLIAADKVPPKKPSTFATAAEVATQIETYLKQIETDLAGETEYGDDQKGRVAKDANTVVVLAQLLANHDEDHPLKKAAPAIVTAARKLADDSGELASAKTAFAALKEGTKSTAGGAADWKPVAELAQLMKQVPIVNNKLRSGVTGKRFDRTIDQNAGYAATLAAIAEASQFDTAYCSSKEEEGKWAKICIEMRDAAAEVRNAVRSKDQSTAKSGLDKLVKTCDDCHHAFRD